MRRLAYLFIGLFFIFIMSLPIFAFALAARGELMLGSDQGSNVRLFMVNTDQAEGIGFQRITKVGPNGHCLKGSVRYILWQGQGDKLSADYCTCVDAESGYAAPSNQCDGYR